MLSRYLFNRHIYQKHSQPSICGKGLKRTTAYYSTYCALCSWLSRTSHSLAPQIIQSDTTCWYCWQMNYSGCVNLNLTGYIWSSRFAMNIPMHVRTHPHAQWLSNWEPSANSSLHISNGLHPLIVSDEPQIILGPALADWRPELQHRPVNATGYNVTTIESASPFQPATTRI